MIKRCMNCMQEMGDFDVCMKCGWIEGEKPKELCHLESRMTLGNEDRYVIGTTVGFGGFGIIYRAWDVKLDVQVAVKEFFPSGLVNRAPGEKKVTIYSGERQSQFQDALARFLAEARNLAKFNRHPHIVNVIDFFEENNTAYIVMEFLEGVSLKQYLKQVGGKLPLENALAIITPVLDALQAAHAQGIVHRDVSPDNIFITSANQIKLIDFGAARLSQGEKEETLSVILKPGYAPPEQYRSKSRQGPFTDIYALGATLYRMLTGQIPEESVDRLAQDTLAPPSELNPAIPTYIDGALMKAMALNSDFRYQKVEDFGKALLGESHTGDVTEEIERARKIRKGILGFSAGLIIATATALFLLATFWKPAEKLTDFPLGATEISVWIPVEEGETSPLRAVADVARARLGQYYSQITVRVQEIPREDYQRRLEQAALAGEMPNVFFADGLAMDITEMTEPLDLLMESISRKNYCFLEQYQRYFPHQRYLPTGFEAPVLYANADIVAGKNVHLTAQRMSERGFSDAMSGLVGSELSGVAISPAQYGAFALSLEDTPLTGEPPVEKMRTGSEKINALPLGDPSENAVELLENGEVCCYVGSSGEFEEIQKRLPGYYSIYPLPGENIYPARFTNLWCVGKTESQEEKVAAMQFLNTLLGDYTQNLMCLQNKLAMPLHRKTLNTYFEVKGELAFLKDYLDKFTFAGEAQWKFERENETLYQENAA